ncbi:hypothetical protein ACFY0R_42060, partial [Streptomyces sp. NPDC001633]
MQRDTDLAVGDPQAQRQWEGAQARHFKLVFYGFWPLRRAHDAIAEIHFYGTHGYGWGLDADIKACFDSIDHTALTDRVRDRVKDKRVLRLAKAFLKAGVHTQDNSRED